MGGVVLSAEPPLATPAATAALHWRPPTGKLLIGKRGRAKLQTLRTLFELLDL